MASWFSVDGPLSPDCSAPLNVNQLTKLNIADSPLTCNRGGKFKFDPLGQDCFITERWSLLLGIKKYLMKIRKEDGKRDGR